MQKLIIVIGPTASGKSDLAVLLAREIKKHTLGGYGGAEIISADSRQVYKYLNVGTNKVTPLRWGHPALDAGSTTKKWIPGQARNDKVPTYKSIPHHCIDFVHPRKIYTVAEYKICAEKAISVIRRRNMIPILVGGSGLYIQAIADGLLLPEVPPNKKLRLELEKKSTTELFRILQKLDLDRATHIDSKNPRRLIRAIEICKATGKQISKLNSHSEFQTLFIGIKKSDAELKHALELRSKKQIPGLLQEVKLLMSVNISKKRIREFGFEYKLGLIFLDTHSKHGMTKKELADMLAKENWRYTRRQMTWFKRDTRIQWIQKNDKALYSMKKFLRESK
ncbi:MAG: hypothetical protein A3J55_02690 [Candidatus Ryanbacteria bacterium RIFCSPHIGHO2_02_FULL_45_17b]|nr:MAG: hypothetical protein A3J55_02690 [Candidatus Ryanbacteria bacterium RIFCSPHIGHO2_02_FULL_45_17b]